MKTFWLIAFSACLSILWIGCETTTAGGRKNEQIYLRKGMSAAEVKELLGEPLKVVRTEGQNKVLETWTYEDTKEIQRQVQAGTREVPYTNPITRETTTITEAITTIKTDRITLVTDLFIIDGILTGWKETTHESVDFRE
ncbi:MAG: hypothetical protein KJT03_08195 [Verrucomicrobiae bacterium]|nr:hypothetical protein [Verrucomicrobiae bacterium]